MTMASNTGKRCSNNLLRTARICLSFATVLVSLGVAVHFGKKASSSSSVGAVDDLLLSTPNLLASSSRRRLSEAAAAPNKKITVFSVAQDHPIARKQRQELTHTLSTSTTLVEPVILTLEEQRSFVESHAATCGGNKALEQFDELVRRKQDHLAVELWKYCALASHQQQQQQPDAVAVYLDSSSPLLSRLETLLESIPSSSSVAVLGDSYFPQTIHGSLLVLQSDKQQQQQQQQIAPKMLSVLVDTPVDVLVSSPLLLPRTLYALIAVQVNGSDDDNYELHPGRQNNGNSSSSWYLLEQVCHMDPLRRRSKQTVSWTDTNSYRLAHYCPEKTGFCCSIHDSNKNEVILMSRHPLLPYQTIASEDLMTNIRPYNAEAGHYEEDELPFISTIREQVFHRPTDYASPNFYESLLENDCLPNQDSCTKCLRDKTGADCQKCGDVCSCYCKALCHEPVAPKFVSKKLIVTPPLYSRDPNRIIPRIVHQTWFESLSREKYPNMSRLVESFRRSGWEYKFYSDEDAANFLSTHFPAEVREAYDTLRPGAFKADLFRYCVLLIHGGVYADVDIMLESALDFAVPPDVGFMVPVDEPGIPVKKRMCLWNGLIAAAPGHPYLVKAIETVVNQVRNRFTSVDMDATFCPNPELSILHAFDTLFTAGPCLLGSSINRVLGRHGQTPFEPGELFPWKEGQLDQSKRGTNFVMGAEKLVSRIPGRTIILSQNKWDMGAHRFTLLEQNLVVAATDLPYSNDREKLESKTSGGGGGEHYSKTHAKTGVYGLEGLYVDKRKANEDIQMFVDASRESTKVTSIA